MVEEARRTGRVHGEINSTFITLIPKNKGTMTFEDYRPISICNTLYKIISQTVMECIKGVLSRHISPEQFGFMHDRGIHDATTITQETIHSIHSRKMKVTVMKIDLSKACDRVDWTLLCMILYKVGMTCEAVEWIMRCIMGAPMAIIINRTPSIFFKVGKGLRQGCELSPLLFIMTMCALSNKINSKNHVGSIKGINIAPLRDINHNFFVDDILIKEIWEDIRENFDKFYKASKMIDNAYKSCLYFFEESPEIKNSICEIFNSKCSGITHYMTYLGFHLKPSNYRVADWLWIVDKHKRKINGWSLKWLSRGGGTHTFTGSSSATFRIMGSPLHHVADYHKKN